MMARTVQLISALCVAALALGCDDSSTSGAGAADGGGSIVDLGAGGGEGDSGGALGDGTVGDGAVGSDSDVVADPDVAFRRDMGTAFDAAADMMPDPDMMAGPDVGAIDGERCDPRLNSVACEAAGAFCVHVPGAPTHIGACQPGDGCNIVDGTGCADPNKPYCHLKGAATVCTARGALRAGDACIDDEGTPQACEAGLVCNNSVCQQPCVPGVDDPGCPDDGRCADISARVGVEGTGLCAPRGCSWFDGAGCGEGEKCNYAIRNDGVLVGSCRPLAGPGNTEASPCAFQQGGGDNCAPGLLCIGPANAQRFCRVLCDTGAYEAPCPAGARCVERLGTQLGPVRGYGICITNQ